MRASRTAPQVLRDVGQLIRANSVMQNDARVTVSVT